MKRVHWLWLLVFLAGILFLELASIREKTFTADEEDHYGYGWNILMLNPDSRIVGNGTLMPFNSLNALPRLIGRQLPEGRIRNFLIDLETGRLVTMLFSLLLAFYVFKWSRELYGIAAGFFSLFLFAFSPTLIAHSRLITNDIFSACLMTVSLYYFWRFISSGGWKLAIITAVLAGVSQVVKYTMLAIYPIFIVILLCNQNKEIAGIIREGKWKALAQRCLVFSGYCLFFGLIGLLMINVGFLFHGTFTPLDEYNFKSLSWQTIQSQSGLLGQVPLPLPTLYLEGPDDRKWEEETGEHANNYLFGELRNPGYFPGYFFWAYLYKVPLALQLTIILSGIVYLKNRRSYAFRKNEIFLWVPILLFTIYLNFFLFIQSGFRFIIPVFPLLLVMGGNLLKNWQAFSRAARIGIGLLSTCLIVSVLSYFPHYLSYFNELVWDRKLAYKILADSNLGWGQNRNYLDRYRSEHPEVIFSPTYPRAGRIVLRANDLVGLFRPGEYRWLRENFEPVDHVAYTYLVYDVTPESLQDALRR
ncbi:MAG: glycosyltransferase family 39 protein [Candidatus Erginobacter occultus]|nr:glycosyltransferase family 39 protein [Candidatus Erginobacter occultus]